MKKFEHVEDVEEWLEPMSYDEYWFQLSAYGLGSKEREHCDKCIKDGALAETVLSVIKNLTRIDLTKELGLELRPVTPWVQLVD